MTGHKTQNARVNGAQEKAERRKKIKNKQNRQGTFINYYLNIPLIFTFCQCVCVFSLCYIVVIVLLVICAREAKNRTQGEQKREKYSTYLPCWLNEVSSECNQIRNGNEHRAKTKKKLFNKNCEIKNEMETLCIIFTFSCFNRTRVSLGGAVFISYIYFFSYYDILIPYSRCDFMNFYAMRDEESGTEK